MARKIISVLRDKLTCHCSYDLAPRGHNSLRSGFEIGSARFPVPLRNSALSYCESG